MFYSVLFINEHTGFCITKLNWNVVLNPRKCIKHQCKLHCFNILHCKRYCFYISTHNNGLCTIMSVKMWMCFCNITWIVLPNIEQPIKWHSELSIAHYTYTEDKIMCQMKCTACNNSVSQHYPWYCS